MVESLLLSLNPGTECLGVNHLRRVLISRQHSVLPDQWLPVLDSVLVPHKDQYRDENTSAQHECNGGSDCQIYQSLLLPGGGETVGEWLWYENVCVAGDRCQVEGSGGEDQNRVVPLSQFDQLADTVVTGEADVHYQAGHVGDGVDGDILVLGVAQTSDIYFDVVEEVW